MFEIVGIPGAMTQRLYISSQVQVQMMQSFDLLFEVAGMCRARHLTVVHHRSLLMFGLQLLTCGAPRSASGTLRSRC